MKKDGSRSYNLSKQLHISFSDLERILTSLNAMDNARQGLRC